MSNPPGNLSHFSVACDTEANFARVNNDLYVVGHTEMDQDSLYVGKLISRGTTPAVTLSGGGSWSLGASVSVAGNDISGTVTCTGNATTDDANLTLTFATAYPSQFITVIITPASASMHTITATNTIQPYYMTNIGAPQSSGFTVTFPAAGVNIVASPVFNYFVIDAVS
jgi:hypothetical protein